MFTFDVDHQSLLRFAINVRNLAWNKETTFSFRKRWVSDIKKTQSLFCFGKSVIWLEKSPICRKNHCSQWKSLVWGWKKYLLYFGQINTAEIGNVLCSMQAWLQSRLEMSWWESGYGLYSPRLWNFPLHKFLGVYIFPLRLKLEDLVSTTPMQ